MLINILARTITVLIFSTLISACNQEEEKTKTLVTIDIGAELPNESKADKIAITKSESDIRNAYINYLENASKSDLSRSEALNRLAEIEFKLSEQLLQKSNAEIEAANLAEKKLDRTIELLETSIADYPDAENNDVTLYQLAKAYDQKDNYENTHIALAQLVIGYPDSIYYLEAQFRLAEQAFSQKKYGTAEDKYTGIINAKNNDIFAEKSFYKRGWARFKQEFYFEAADDFVQVINTNDFDEFDTLSPSKQNLFSEYFRALGLSFAYSGGADELQDYLFQTELFTDSYYVYQSLSDIFLKQQRYSDAAYTLESYISSNPQAQYNPIASLNVINIWKTAGFVMQRNDAFEEFYNDYQPNSTYWNAQAPINKKILDQTSLALKELILVETATYHQKYQKTKKEADFAHAQRWYQNYLKNFDRYSRQDNIHYLLASLYFDHNDIDEAFKHFKLAGFDESTIINKDAAYKTISLTSTLYKKSASAKDKSVWLNQLINFSTLYAQQYPSDKLTLSVVSHAADLAYKNELYTQTISLSELVVEASSSTLMVDLNTIKAHAYFQTKQYATAEGAYLAILSEKKLSKKERKNSTEALALAIYYQGNIARDENQLEDAAYHYARIYKVAPNTSTASIGLYDAIAMAMTSKQWLKAIVYIKDFRKLYPNDKNSTDVAKKLSVAYLNSEQSVEAAIELEKLSSNESSREYKMASLLKAAELYQDNGEYKAAIRSYEKYVKKYAQPFDNYIESLYQLAQITRKLKQYNASLKWQNKIIRVDKKTSSSVKTDRSNFIASSATMALARQNKLDFSRVKLVKPLAKNLKHKKKTMQASVNFYARASSYGIAETATEATYAIATIYNDFSKALLTSEIPAHLSADEAEQYEFLLEDQAFPFEEKAIEFFEVNLLYTQDDIYDQWVEKSLTELKQLFPIRYQRQPKIEKVINVLH